MMTMETFQREGIETYDQAAIRLKRDGNALAFDTPKHHVTILGTLRTMSMSRTAC